MQTLADFLTHKEARRQLERDTDDTLLHCNTDRFSELCQVEKVIRIFRPGNVVGLVMRHRCKKGTVLGYEKSKTGLWRMAVLMYPEGPVRLVPIDPRSYQGDIVACQEPERDRVYLYQSFCWSKRTHVALIVDKRVI